MRNVDYQTNGTGVKLTRSTFSMEILKKVLLFLNVSYNNKVSAG